MSTGRFRNMLGGALLAASAVFSALAPTALWADVKDYQTIYRHRSWEVVVIAYDDGSYACRAVVGDGDRSFSVWAYRDQSVRLQFYDRSWEFGEDSATVIVRIDRRAKWNLNNATLRGSSVLFDLPDEDASFRFLREVMRGNVANLYSQNGALIERYSLSGSRNSIVKLTECVDGLKSFDGDKNPFN